MKFVMVFLLVCVALATAAPQFIAYPGWTHPAAARTVVAGPTVVNGWGGPYYTPGFVGTTFV